MIISSSRLQENSLNKKSKQVQSKHVSAWISDIVFHCYCFGCRLWSLWLQLIQNHARDCFQAFEHLHLTWLSCSVFNWNLSRYHFFGQVVGLDLVSILHRIRLGTREFVPIPSGCIWYCILGIDIIVLLLDLNRDWTISSASSGDWNR